MLKGQLARLVESTPNVVVREIDIVDSDSAAFEQMEREYDVQGIPYTRVYGKEGQFVGDVSGADIDALRELVNRGS